MSGPGPPRSSASATQGPKKKEKWLVTRKTWRYMADAGKLLIPESLRKGKDMKSYTDDDISNLDDHFQKVCDQQQDFIEWEGPRQDPRVLLAGNRGPPAGVQGQVHDQGPHGPKFRLVLPIGQAPPPGYVQVGKRTLPMGDLISDYEQQASGPQQDSSYVQLPSGLVLQELPAIYLTERDWYARRSSSPPDSGLLSPEDLSYGDEDHFDANITTSHPHHVESGIGSGADSTTAVRVRHVGIQSDPMPEEFYRIQEEEKRREEEEKRRKEEEERLAREKEEKELEAAMGDSVMRYMKMVRRNSKSSDQKKAERFRSMNYDPTLRNIKAKYLNKEENVEGFKKSMEVQVGESLLDLLKKCQTPVEAPGQLPHFRKFSNTTASEISDQSAMSPQRRLSVGPHTHTGPALDQIFRGAEVHGPVVPEVERDFYAHLYSGDMTALESGATIPEDYYTYLDSWYRAQRGLGSPLRSGSCSASAGGPASPETQAQQQAQQTIYIPVDALQNLRASMPALATCAAASSTNTLSRSTNSLGKSPGQSFLSSVISLRPFAGTNASATKIMPKRLWRTRSKSRSYLGASPWAPQGAGRWQHATNRMVVLESSHLLMLHEFERIALQKVSLQKLNSSDLGVTTRIPKDSSDKTKGRTYLLKKKNLLPRWDSNRSSEKSKEPGSSGPVFGVPLGQTVDIPSSRKRSTCGGGLPTIHTSTGVPENIPGSQDELLLSPVSKASRSDSRASFGSIACDPMIKGSTESLFDFRRQSSSGVLDTLSMDEMAELSLAGSVSSPCVPTVVMMCIRHLEQFGLHTVGIFRVSSSKKRVKQLREEFDRGGQITLSMETGVHDVATLLKEFFRDLPEPLIPKEVQPALLAIQRLKNTQDQIIHLQHIIQLLPLINRDTLYVLLQFLGLVAENAEDRSDDAGTILSGNKMDTLNLATLFSPNILHSFQEDLSKGTSSTERMDHVSVLKLLIERRDLVYQVPSIEINDAYVYLNEHFPDVLDALLRRRLALAGIEIPEDFPVEEESTDDFLKRRPSRGVSREDLPTEKPPPAPTEPQKVEVTADDDATLFRFGIRRSSDRRRKMSTAATTTPATEPPKASSLRFQVPSRRKTSTVTTSAVQPQGGREAIVYSPASSSFSMTSVSSNRGSTPCSDIFFGSGTTTPSHMASPPPTTSQFGSPIFLSPPVSPPPLTTIPSTTIDSPTDSASATPIVLSPVPMAPPQRMATTSGQATMPSNTFLSASGQRVIPYKSKTDDLDRYISEIENETKETPTVRKYTRRRYTDNRHTTTELPDVSSASMGAINVTSVATEKPLTRRRTQQLC